MSTNERHFGVVLRSLCLLVVLGTCAGLTRYQIPGDQDLIYSNFVIDQENSKLIVTTTNSMLRLNLDLSEDNQVDVFSDEVAAASCRADFRSTQQCQNYHRVLVLPKGAWQITGDNGSVWNASQTVLTCSSNAYAPKCYYRNRHSLALLASHPSTHFNPFGPFEWIPSLWSSSGNLVVATPLDDKPSTFGITMSDAPFDGGVQVTTLANQRLWFNKSTPKFVAMYEIGEYIYLFFREEAVEAQPVEKVVYSRVARICKNDTGTLHSNTNIFTTFIKARISCTAPAGSNGGLPYHYNDMYGAYYQASHQRLYAVFQSPQNGPMGSVVCTFTFGTRTNDMEGVFRGRYLEEVGQDRFETRDNFDPFTCEAGSRPLAEALRIQLMDSTVAQSREEPVLRLQGYAFQRIIVDTVNGQDVMFITATKEGETSLLLLKVMVLEEGYHVISSTELPTDPASSHVVTKMELQGSGPHAHIYIGTETDIYRVPVQSCSMYTSCCQCVSARDPYCAFDMSHKTCMGSDSSRHTLVQDLMGGDSQLCVAATGSTDDDTTTPVKTCLGPGGDSSTGGGVVVDPSSTGVAGSELPSPDGLGGRQAKSQNQVWIIVGTVLGFIGGVVIGIVVVLIFKHLGFGSRRNKNFDLSRSCEITNETKNPRSRTAVNTEKNRKGSGPSGGNSSGQEEVLRINNSTTELEFTTSNNFTRSNDYTQHVPPHLKMPPSPVKMFPLKSLEAPAAATTTTTTTTAASPQKKCLTPSPPSLSPPPSASSGYKSQGSIFTFHPSSMHATSVASTPKSAASFSRSVSGASAYSDSPLQMSTERPANADPNLQLNYKAKVYLTSEEKAAYGRNILARMPSIDGSKSKYLMDKEGGGRASSSSLSYECDSLPRAGYHPHPHRRHDIVHLDTELGCSQC